MFHRIKDSVVRAYNTMHGSYLGALPKVGTHAKYRLASIALYTRCTLYTMYIARIATGLLCGCME